MNPSKEVFTKTHGRRRSLCGSLVATTALRIRLSRIRNQQRESNRIWWSSFFAFSLVRELRNRLLDELFDRASGCFVRLGESREPRVSLSSGNIR